MDKNTKEILDILIEKSRNRTKEDIIFVPTNINADNLIKDLTNYPHAFFFGCIFDRQIKAIKAWEMPYKLKQYLEIEYGLNFEFETLYLNKDKVYDWIINYSGHRFKKQIADCIINAFDILKYEYNGNASEIWITASSCKIVSYRFSRFKGIGQKISSMATNILVRDFKVDIPDKSFIDISFDVHIERIFSRVFYGNRKLDKDEIIWKARELNPEYPGIIDLPLWYLGENKICSENEPSCYKCYLNKLCKFTQ